MSDLQDYVWLREQWRRFRHMLMGGLSAVLILCTSGLLLLRDEEDPAIWFYTRLALMIALVAATAVALWLWIRASREIRNLSQLATEARLEAARQARETNQKKKGRRSS
ncbi:MAG: hypothetical protein O2782_22480 [bacterium]|nr:hypothetical protein [bacterium]